ncbi:MAG: DNA-primase RepB domain-containing protein [Solirubrobacteraceae bacterium]
MRAREDIPQGAALRLYLAMLGADRGLLELRYRKPGGPMRQEFSEPTANRTVGQSCPHRLDPRRASPAALASRIVELATEHDVYVGCAPRTRRSGGLDAIEQVFTLWTDCDGAAAVAALAAFEPKPAMVVLSGTGPNRHAYWPLRAPLSPGDARRANRRLAHALGADMASTDAARILRPPGTLNHKHAPARRVVCDRLEVVSYDAREIVGRLADPPTARGDEARVIRLDDRRLPNDDVLRTLDPATYVQALTGEHVPASGTIRCPLPDHQDDTPSFHAYPDADSGWYCFGCARGGTIYDLAAQLWGVDTRGASFHDLRRRVAETLLAAA